MALLVPNDSLLHIALAKQFILMRGTSHFSSWISTAIYPFCLNLMEPHSTTDAYTVKQIPFIPTHKNGWPCFCVVLACGELDNRVGLWKKWPHQCLNVWINDNCPDLDQPWTTIRRRRRRANHRFNPNSRSEIELIRFYRSVFLRQVIKVSSEFPVFEKKEQNGKNELGLSWQKF